MIAFGKTHIGKVRKNNEDNIFVSEAKIGDFDNLFIVADGMGGHNAGEIASGCAIDYFCQYLLQSKVVLDFEGKIMDGIFYANSKVYNDAIIEPGKTGMGTTITLCTICNGKIFIGHVGDSRLYKINNNGIQLLTIDHTYVNEMVAKGLMTTSQAKIDPNRNLVTRALGVESTVMVDYYEDVVSPGDKILICSDGLTGMVTDSSLCKIVLESSDTELAVDRLIVEAMMNGGQDNISAILISM